MIFSGTMSQRSELFLGDDARRGQMERSETPRYWPREKNSALLRSDWGRGAKLSDPGHVAMPRKHKGWHS